MGDFDDDLVDGLMAAKKSPEESSKERMNKLMEQLASAEIEFREAVQEFNKAENIMNQATERRNLSQERLAKSRASRVAIIQALNEEVGLAGKVVKEPNPRLFPSSGTGEAEQ